MKKRTPVSFDEIPALKFQESSSFQVYKWTMVLWPSCFAKFMVVLPDISLQIPQCDYAHIRVVLTQWLRMVHPTSLLVLPSPKAEALMCLGIGGSWPSANLVIFLRFKSLHSPSSLFESVQSWSPYPLNPMRHICSKFLWSQITLSHQQQHNKRLKLIQNDRRNLSHSWILKDVWRSGAFQPIGNLTDYLYNWKTSPRKKKNWIDAGQIFWSFSFTKNFPILSTSSVRFPPTWQILKGWKLLSFSRGPSRELY